MTDAEAIKQLNDAFKLQRAAFLKDPYPSYESRVENLGKLAAMMISNRMNIRKAMNEDFGSHPDATSDIVECLGVAGRAKFVIENLKEWMKPEERAVDAQLMGNARAAINYQPKGVVGNLVPFNFPFDLGLGPVCEMLGAGNRVIIKPSDLTPACAKLIQKMVKETFPEDLVTVVVGGLELAKAFPTIKWNHLLYTGSPTVGRLVMAAAAVNLTPVTLELGGKCPAIVHSDSVTAETVDSIIGTKMLKNGQMCVSVDYALVPRTAMDEFVNLAKKRIASSGGYANTTDCTGIIAQRHLDRLVRILDEASKSGAKVVPLEDIPINPKTRQMPLSLVLDPPKNISIMTEEIFGPILPIIPYDDLNKAIEEINDGERPLGLYVFSKDDKVTENVLTNTVSGGAAVNACAMQAALPSLGFGGSGESGIGRHHGFEGFREFSNPRGVVHRGNQGDLIPAFYPPCKMGEQVADAAFQAATNGAH